MVLSRKWAADVEAIVARRHDQGDDLWTTPDRRLAKGGPFSTLGAARLLVELGVDPAEPILVEARELIWSARRVLSDGLCKRSFYRKEP